MDESNSDSSLESSLVERVPAWVTSLAWLLNRIGQGSAWMVVLMVVLMALIVVLRYVLGIGSIALQETVIYMHAGMIMTGASYALLHNAHVRVDVLYRGWNRTRQAWIDVLGTVFFLFPICIFTIRVSLSYVAGSWRIFEGSAEAGGLPGVFLLKSLLLWMPILLIAAGIVRMAHAVSTIRGKREE